MLVGERAGDASQHHVQLLGLEVRRCYCPVAQSPHKKQQERGGWVDKNTFLFVFLFRHNGSKILFENATSAEAMTIPWAAVGEDSALWLTVTAYNHLGASRSEPLELLVQDIGSFTSLCVFSTSTD